MFLLISIVLIAFSVGGLSILQYAFHVYNDEIYRQSAQSLSLSSMSIENELKKMERLSYQVSTDQSIQNYLFELKRSTNEFDKFLMSNELKKRLLQLGALNKYVKSIQVYDWEDFEHKVGNQVTIISENQLEEIKKEADEKEGGAKWFFLEKHDQTLMITRNVRYYIRLSLEQLGVVVVRIDIEKIITDIVGNLNKNQTSLVIFNENDELIYSTDDQVSFNYTANDIEGNDGYKLLNINNEQYFVTYRSAQHTDWTYVILSPYSSLFKA